MSEINAGGSAFPNPCLADEAYAAQPGDYGMTLRDWYAGKALSGFCANPAIFAGNNQNGWDLVNCTEPQLAQVAHRIAGEMIAAREGNAGDSLTAAAPDLLEAVRALNVGEADIVGGTSEHIIVRLPIRALTAAAAAIAKAEGRS